MITRKEIKPYIESGLISEGVHPEDSSYRIYNYTNKCQFDKGWDDVTTQCRGLIFHNDDIIARPFSKFFNIGERIDDKIPNEKPVITEKFDGSLGILYDFEGEARIATRGSFESDQALWATEWWHMTVGKGSLGRDKTHLFEIIYPENRIVVQYHFSGLVHLATLDTKTGEQVACEIPIIMIPKEIPPTDFEALKEMDTENEEGFVIFYQKANYRLKIKFPDYVRLHRLVTGVNAKTIWDLLRNHQSFDELIDCVPDEFYKWVKITKRNLEASLQNLKDQIDIAFATLDTSGDRKSIALQIQRFPKYVRGMLFAKLDHKDYEPLMWKYLRPVAEKPFAEEI